MNESGNRDDGRCYGWDDESRGKLAHARTLTFRQRLEWLEAMGDLVDHLQRDPEWRRRKARVEGRAVVAREDPPRSVAPIEVWHDRGVKPLLPFVLNAAGRVMRIWFRSGTAGFGRYE